MDKFESLRAIKIKQAELVAQKKGTSVERRRYKADHLPNTAFEIVFGEKVDAYIRFFINSDIDRSKLRDDLRCLHLASCFLRHTPYSRVESRVNDEGRIWCPLDGRICNLVQKYCGIEFDRAEIRAWIHLP